MIEKTGTALNVCVIAQGPRRRMVADAANPAQNSLPQRSPDGQQSVQRQSWQ